MIKRLLNPHILLKITLIFTTLFLLMPNIMLAKSYITTGVVKYVSVQGSTYTHTWAIDDNLNWQITHPRGSNGITSQNNKLPFTLNNGESMTLTTTKPTSESINFRMVTLSGLAEGLKKSLTATVTFPNENSLETLTLNGESFEPSTPRQWGENDKITITLSNNTGSSISCTISSITVLTGTQGSATFSWVDEATSPLGSNYDVSEIVKSVSGNDVVLSGKCEQNAIFSFRLNSSSGSHTIAYSSNKTSVAEVDVNGIVTVKSKGEATITAVPEGDDNYYYLPLSYRLIITDIYQFCGLIVGGARVTTGNHTNILKDNGGSIASFDREKSELTLNGVALSSGIEYQGAKPLIIKVVGSNSISNAGNYAICMPEGIDILQKLIFTRESTDNESTLQLASQNSVINNFSEIEFEGALLDFNTQDVFYDTSSRTLKKADQGAKNATISPAYPLWIEGAHVTSTNKDNILNDNYHTVSFDGNHTLSLNGAILSNGGIYTNLNSLTIKLTDASQISASIDDSTCIKSTNGGAITIVKDVNSTAFENLLVLHHYNGSAIRGISSISIGQGLVTTPETETPSIWINEEDYILITDNKQYDLSVGGIPVSENNRNHILGEGNNSVTYDPENNTLILNGANINGSNNGGLGECPGVDYYGEKDLKIKIYGTSNIIVGTSGCEGIRFNSMTGSPKLIFEKGDNNCSLTIRSEYETRSAICGFSNIEYQGLFIQSSLPCNYSESAKKLINPLNSSDSDPINEATITSTTTYQLWIGGEQVTSNNMSNGIVGITLELDNERYNTITKGSEGVLSFNPEGNVLTLSNVTINPLNRNYSPIISNLPNLKVNINGHSTLSGFGGDIIRNEAFTSLYNSAPLVLSSDNPEDALMQIDVTRLDDVANGFDLSTSDGLYCGFGNTVIVQKLKSPSISLSNDILILNNSNLVNTGMELYYKITDAQGQSGEDKKFETSVGSSQGINGPCTIEAWAKYGEQTSPHGIAKLFAYPTETSIEAYYNTEMTPPALVPEGLPSSATLSYDFSDFPDMFTVTNQGKIIPNALTDNTEGVPVMTSFTLSSELPFTILNDCYTENDVTTYYISNPFSIIVKPKELTSNMIQDIPNLMYNGSEIQPDISVKDGEKMLTKAKTADDGDYTISYSNNISAALSTANNAPTVTVTGKGNYTGTAAKTFTITAKSLADATVTLADNKTEFTYNEAANVPTITRVYLTEGAETPTTTIELTANDYTISYVKVNGETEEAIEADKIINAGSYKMILTGKGNFSGTRAVEFTIIPRTITNLSFSLSATNFTYNGEAQKPTVTVQFEETELEATKGTTKTIPTTDYDLTFSGECINAGTYSVSASLKGNYSGSGDGPSFTITKATISPKVTLDGWTYGATANEPSVSGNTGNGEVTYAYKLQNEAESAFAAEVPTNAGAYTVKASIAATANYEAASDTAQFVIAKATPTLSFSATTASLTMDEEVTGLPTLSNPSGLAVTYTSSNSEVATISEDGIVTPVAPGETTISATIATSNNYEGISASYVLTVNKSKRYGLKVGDTEVTEDNKNDILGDGDLDANKRPTFLFNPTDTTLLVINSEEGLTIESRLPELKIHLTGEKNKLKSIIFNNQDNTENIGKLIFTSDDAFPGKVTIANTAGESAIRGFESISFAEICKLLILSPEEAVYQNGTIGADTVIIGQLINPMTNGTTVTFNNDDFTVINPDGTQEEADLSSYTSNEIHYTLPGTTDGQGYDASTNTITVIDAMNDEEVQKIAKAAKDNTTTVGSGEYAQQFIGLTFMVAGGEGDIEIDQEVIPGYAFHLKIGEDTPKALGEGVAGRLLAKEHYKVDAATYCWLYLVENAVAASRAVARKWGDTRVGKRDRMHGAIYSVSVKPNKVKSANPPSQASGGIIPAAEGDKIETEGIQGVKVVNTVDDRWFTIDGRQIDKPTQKGLYIHNRKKVVVK